MSLSSKVVERRTQLKQITHGTKPWRGVGIKCEEKFPDAKKARKTLFR